MRREPLEVNEPSDADIRFAPISLRNVGRSFRYMAIPRSIGLRRGSNCSRKRGDRKPSKSSALPVTGFDAGHTFLNFFDQLVDRERLRDQSAHAGFAQELLRSLFVSSAGDQEQRRHDHAAAVTPGKPCRSKRRASRHRSSAWRSRRSAGRSSLQRSSKPYSGFGEVSTSQRRNDVSASRVTRINPTSSSTMRILFGSRSRRHEWTLARKHRAFQAFPMNEALAELAAALRERLTIIADEESRRDPEHHIERLKKVSLRLEQLEASCRQRLIRSCAISCSGAAIQRRSSI